MMDEEWIYRITEFGKIIPVKRLIRCKDCYYKKKQFEDGSVICNLDLKVHGGSWYCPSGKGGEQDGDEADKNLTNN